MTESAVGTLFQFFDLLPDDEFAALKADIAKRGVLVPIEYDQDGNILDGHHRHRACQELGIKDYPTVVRRFASDDDKEEHVVTLNVRRRHLNGDQKRKWVEWFLRRHPERADNSIAGEVGVDDKTVAAVRSDLEATSEIPKLDYRVGKDGKKRQLPKTKPAPPPTIFTTARNTDRAQSAVATQERPGVVDLKRAERIARETAAELRRAEQVEPVTISGTTDIRHGDFRHVLADIPDGSVDAIITDPPYPGEFVDLFEDLSHLAARVLKHSGVLAVMCGQYYLPEYIALLSAAMRYRWCGAYIAQGPRTRIHAAKVGTGWKPILIFQRHGITGDDLTFILDDLFDSAGDDKRHHHWGQSESGTGELVERLTAPGALVVDPFLGGGTTAVVCRDLGRQFIGCDIDAAHIATARERVA